MGTLKKILLVDDDDDLREALSEQLVMTEDFDVFEADSGVNAMTKAKEGIYDLVILDVGLPDTDGRELCRRMRKQNVKCPIIMLTAMPTPFWVSMPVRTTTSPSRSSSQYFWPGSARSFASTNSPRTPFSSLDPIRSSRR